PGHSSFEKATHTFPQCRGWEVPYIAAVSSRRGEISLLGLCVHSAYILRSCWCTIFDWYAHSLPLRWPAFHRKSRLSRCLSAPVPVCRMQPVTLPRAKCVSPMVKIGSADYCFLKLVVFGNYLRSGSG